ncbi:hypothetical protein [Blastomonas aquatica]|uniref:Avidin n=1 Tax=Blastomonas aquatica TaxID=1510276 RepID=A0ABQ1JC34_9SPHN|nr:hypothetical protein [Blastomonas aquatica]GGB62618.1 hypothetical protein GCM10010833_17010 [Blastomonas aquatica]
MSFGFKTLTALTLLSAAAIAQAAPPQNPVTGVWTTDFGTVTLTQNKQGEISGSYETDDGRITGTVDNNVIDGFWIESASDYTCDTAKMGSRHWGRIRFELNSAGTGWTGIWSYCDYDYVPGAVWNGKRSS